MTTFLDPTTDIVFKKLFGEQDRAHLLMGLLNGLLELPAGEQFVEVAFNDLAAAEASKNIAVDATCTDSRGRQFIVELQVAAEQDYQEQSQYAAAQALVRQLKKKATQSALVPVIFIALADARLFNDARYQRNYRLMDAETHETQLHHTRFLFVELPKFTKAADDLSSTTDRWLYFFKHTANLETAPKQLEKVPEIKEALAALTDAKLTRKELDAYEQEIKLRRITQAQQEAEEHARRQGMQDAQRKIIEQMLSALSMEQVADITKFSVEEIQGLLG